MYSLYGLVFWSSSLDNTIVSLLVAPPLDYNIGVKVNYKTIKGAKERFNDYLKGL